MTGTSTKSENRVDLVLEGGGVKGVALAAFRSGEEAPSRREELVEQMSKA
jgi:hypothetical protein